LSHQTSQNAITQISSVLNTSILGILHYWRPQRWF